MSPKFVHLHVHSHYSLLDGLAKIPDLVKRAKELGMEAIALTDHGVLYGAVEFFKSAKKAGIKAIIGQELYLTPGSRHDKRPKVDDVRYHLIVLAKNETGYKNLVQLTTKAHLEGFYYKPRVDKELLRAHSAGLIALSGCMNGELARTVRSGDLKKAEVVAREYQEIFGRDNYYIEIWHHPGVEGSRETRAKLVELAKKLNIPLVATQDVHYLRPEDKEAQDILMAVNTGSNLAEEDRLSLRADDFSLASTEKMAEYFAATPEAVENTARIAELCTFEFKLGQTQLPHFKVPTDQSPEEYLRQVAYAGLNKRYGASPEPKVKERLDYELSVIEKTGFTEYILIVHDFVAWAKQNSIVVGPGRGSTAGSIVAYLLGITALDPLKYELLFERFLNPDRISMPDIDLDFADTRRDEVIRYVKKKYGDDHVAQIITFGTMAARAAVRDTGRALGLPYSFCDTVAKLVPFNLPLEKSLERVAELRQLYDTDPQARSLLDAARKLEGVARHASTHACGVVITKEPLADLIPLQRATRGDETIVTQYEMRAVEDLGLLKMDFLGLKNLTIIEETINDVASSHGVKIELDTLPLNDKKTFELLKRGETTGVFQLESGGMKRYLKELKPTEFEDIVSMVTLYRPGPLETGMAKEFIERKHGRRPTTYLHTELEPILKKTHGIMIYQEQLMEVVRTLAGFTLAEADVLRKAVGKKIRSLLEEQKHKLVEGMVANNLTLKTAERIWELIEPFARYGFNRCLAGETAVTDPITGQHISLENLYLRQQKLETVFSLEPTWKINPRPITEVFYNGKKPVFQLVTRSGRSIKATANHPFLTPGGWQKLENLSVGKKIAVPRVFPEPAEPLKVELFKLGLLGYFLAEGNFCHPHGFYFYSKSQNEINDYLTFLEAFDNTIGKVDKSKSAIAVYAKRKEIARPAAAVGWIESLGLKYKKATEKFFPEFVYRLASDDLAVVIGKMFQGDGCINLKRKDPQIFYATSSEKITTGLQHLLLRFGILSTIHRKRFKYRGGIKPGFTITIGRYDNIKKFLNTFGEYFVGEKRRVAEEIMATHPILNGSLKPWAARGSYDTIPVSLIRNRLRDAVQENGLSFAEFARKTGVSERLFGLDQRKVGYLRETVALIAEELQKPALVAVAHSDIYWDEIKKIEPVGIEDTYDLSVPETHNFVANDFIVHNSHAACYAMLAFETAYLKAHWPTEFMKALLNADSSDVERIAFLIQEAKDRGLTVLAPEVNESNVNFGVSGPSTIRFGLAAIKNVGGAIAEAIVSERARSGEFKSIENFLGRIDVKDLNKKSLESLIKAGVFDNLGERGALAANIEGLLAFSKETRRARSAGQESIFELAGSAPAVRLRKVEPVSSSQRLSWEKELLGLYISDHPLSLVKEKLARVASPITGLTPTRRNVAVGGILTKLKKILTKNGEPMVFAELEDLSGKIEVVVFPSTLEKSAALWQEEKIVLVRGRIQERDNSLKLICEEVQALEV